MNKIAEIVKAYKNYFTEKDTVTLQEAGRRAAICAQCPHAKRGLHAALLPDMRIGKIQGLYCEKCKCPLSVKVRSKAANCPKEFW